MATLYLICKLPCAGKMTLAERLERLSNGEAAKGDLEKLVNSFYG